MHRKAGRPRGRTVNPNAKPIASGQLTQSESNALDIIAKTTGQSRSELTRRAVVLLLNLAARGEIDFGKAITYDVDNVHGADQIPSGTT